MKRLLSLGAALLVGVGLVGAPRIAVAAAAYGNCTGFVDTVPATVSTPGTWCLRQDLVLSSDVSAAVLIDADRVVLDCNGHAIRYATGTALTASGIRALSRHGVTVRNCKVSGFRTGINLLDESADGSDYVVEDNVSTDNGYTGIRVYGGTIRRNHVARIGGNAALAAHEGIVLLYKGDVLDNTVEKITAGAGHTAYGIHVDGNGNTIRGNRVRGLSGQTGPGSIGLLVNTWEGGRLIVSGNDVAGDLDSGDTGGSIGVKCGQDVNTQIRVGDNVIAGFPVAMLDCNDVLNNDTSL